MAQVTNPSCSFASSEPTTLRMKCACEGTTAPSSSSNIRLICKITWKNAKTVSKCIQSTAHPQIPKDLTFCITQDRSTTFTRFTATFVRRCISTSLNSRHTRGKFWVGGVQHSSPRSPDLGHGSYRLTRPYIAYAKPFQFYASKEVTSNVSDPIPICGQV
jgi:hypothetical protein